MRPFPWATMIIGGIVVVLVALLLAAASMSVQDIHF